MDGKNFEGITSSSRLPLPFAASILIYVLTVPAIVHVEAETVDSILEKAASLVGSPYRIGGTTAKGFDCSGLITYLYKPSLPNLPRLSRDMINFGKQVEPGQWKPCDLLFYATGSDPERVNHVALWYGDDMLIHSVSDGPETGVIMTRAGSKYWKNRYISARRVFPEENAQTPDSTTRKPSTSDKSTAPPSTQVPPSPWDDFNGILRGDFESWLENEKKDFDSYRKENG